MKGGRQRAQPAIRIERHNTLRRPSYGGNEVFAERATSHQRSRQRVLLTADDRRDRGRCRCATGNLDDGHRDSHGDNRTHRDDDKLSTADVIAGHHKGQHSQGENGALIDKGGHGNQRNCPERGGPRMHRIVAMNARIREAGHNDGGRQLRFCDV